ncbi:MAG: DNA polymerase III subunit delta [Candidatus Komeilibacteria bacterium CG11_big_fil_rev_8_21_14_0_20_36_20]|uniref:DNA polymerase III subunit delta n=1 Tax=Candidatus Komeilibacteria bacterium CG11_big_fil_rev_8_21_14_0_20_36_20 TaxID=1974477 RepID=A0A2H0ND05_9BACT|nr:MAG: DNA polymerase III subunit delta [Candidatus Komeilibacteria bacterium CG11_big_fil_rev_8_21_14_0_20_36_20]PIR81796.1 MAG: DNA polymerase III subunit delta [Candidatus Komeilibacteria bacterium CG10_big_fil_rev_8_21_14_0_10_36_65]PJC55286.1 MAG: DNA polymerase III subunit delta [Candidatus Komeilibacteria bacterium CG_4_9_14_0_2_um_filter_36_13]
MIFFYYGENSFLAHQKIEAIVKKFQTEIDPNRQNVQQLDGEDISADDFFQAVRAAGFLATKKLVIIKNIFNNKNISAWQNSLLDFLKKQKDDQDENYIIFWQTNKPDNRLKLYKILKKFKFTEEFNPLTPQQLSAWIKKQVTAKKKSIDDQAVNLLLSYVGDNLWQLNQEVNKLIHFAKQTISENEIKAIVQAKIDDNIFNLIDALGNKNKALSLKLIEAQLNSGTSPQYVLNMIIRQFRLLIKVKHLEQKYPSALAQALKLPNWIAEKTLNQSKLYTPQQLKKIYRQLFFLDEKFKTTSGQEKILFAQMINGL